jgi:glycosyltransferase involved in cell wall biosynthesis
MRRASVIITTHNRPGLLTRAIESARSSGRDVEIVVVDDASSDITAEVCRSVSDIKYVRVERNQGVAGARNVGLIASRGQFISFLDDDDLRLPNSLDQQIEALSNSPAAMLCYAQAIPQDEDGREQPPFPAVCPQGDVLWELLTRNFIPCGTAVFRRECLARIGLLDDSIPRIDDWDLWLRIAELFPVISLKTPVLVWRQSTRRSRQGSSDTIDVINLSISHFHRICLRLPRLANASHHERRKAWRAFSTNLADHLTWESLGALWTGQLRKSFTSGRTLLRLHPSVFVHLIRNWARPATVKMLLSERLVSDNLDKAKVHFKEIRSTPDS